MGLVNIHHPDERVSFAEGVRRGMGRGQGLFMPEQIRPLEDLPALLSMDFVERSVVILDHLTDAEIGREALGQIVASAFDFEVPVVEVTPGVHALELFHGGSLAFKDFGARFMARVLAHVRARGGQEGPITILTATSGDTGAAVAQAFYRQPGIDVVILYPAGRISSLQEKLFCTIGGNVRTFAVEDDFDACQALVKRSFDDPELREALGLNSANSINIARLLAQVCYYFEAAAQLPSGARPVYSVPSGNFGNVTAALVACVLGLPASRIVAATNANDTVPRFLKNGRWDPRPTIATMTSAMDISRPNNFDRVRVLGERYGAPIHDLLVSAALDDEGTAKAMRALHQAGYTADPHSALAWRVLQDHLAEGATGVFLCTAHPAKFREEVNRVLGVELNLPTALREVADKEVLSEVISADFSAFRSHLLRQV